MLTVIILIWLRNEHTETMIFAVCSRLFSNKTVAPSWYSEWSVNFGIDLKQKVVLCITNLLEINHFGRIWNLSQCKPFIQFIPHIRFLVANNTNPTRPKAGGTKIMSMFVRSGPM